MRRKRGASSPHTEPRRGDDRLPLQSSSSLGLPGDLMLKAEHRHRILASYLKLLDLLRGPVRSESELPFSKHLIQQAILEELQDNPASELRSHLEVGFAELESFIPVEEYEMLQRFKETFSRAEELAEGGAPKDILASCRLLERISGERVVHLLERISQTMRERFNAVQCIGMPSSLLVSERSFGSG